MEGEDSLAYIFKVHHCTIRRHHSWLYCPFYHRGEWSRRRDPKKHFYHPTPCRNYRGRFKICPWGDDCRFSHGFLEVKYHPDRFRTEPCWYGSGCKRPFCSFAHGHKQLRRPRYRNIRGPWNQRSRDSFAPSSSAAGNHVHDHRTVRPPGAIPSAIGRANGNDHASPNSPAESRVNQLPDLFEEWRRGNYP